MLRGPALFVGPASLTIAAALAVYWPALGRFGLSHSEGHRAIPGWAMLEDGVSLLPRLFETLYLRKPPGMPWAIAGASWLLGENEFAARSVSALASTVAALVSCLVACLWFGRRAGAVAGVAFCLTPLFIYPGRSAEIEALNNLFTLLSMLGVIHVTLSPSFRPLATLATVVAVSLMLIVKGPAGLPCVFASLVAAGIASGRLGGVVRSVRTWTITLVPLMVFAAFLLASRRAWEATGEQAITEPPSHFLWNPAKLGAILGLPVIALASALPHGLALPLSFMSAPLSGHADTRARAVRLACLVSLVAYALVGVANPRYAMPALAILPLCCGMLAAQWSTPPSLSPRARRVAAQVTWCGLVVLLIGAWVHGAWIEYRRGWRTSGRDAGIALASHLPDGAVVHAFELIDVRPEVAWYAQREARAHGRQVRVVWDPYPGVFGRSDPPLLPPAGHFLLLRTDAGRRDQYPAEVPEYQRGGLLDRLGPPVAGGRVHQFEFTLFRVP
jgi:4-amino-4-deoxy-L-arabinose transferase-like glycosyltransferase